MPFKNESVFDTFGICPLFEYSSGVWPFRAVLMYEYVWHLENKTKQNIYICMGIY